MNFIFRLILILLSSCAISNQESNPNVTKPLPPIVTPTSPTFPDLEVNSWKYLESSQSLSKRTVSDEHITVSDNNTPYISFSQLGYTYVYRWNGSTWIQEGNAIPTTSHDSLVTYKNVPYITYEYEEQSFVKKISNNEWIDAHNDNSLPINNLNSVSLYAYKDKLYLAYISETDKKLHVNYLENNSWKPFGETSTDRYRGSANNGIQMAFYNDTPYIALKKWYSGDPCILVLKNNLWESIPAPTIPSSNSVNSDYFFYIDSVGSMYISFLSGLLPVVGTFQIFKLYNNAWIYAMPFANQLFGYQTFLYEDQLYIAYSHSISSLVHLEDKVKFNKFSDSLGLEDIGKHIVSDDVSTGSYVKLAIKDNHIYVLFLARNRNTLVVKAALLQ